MPVTDYEFHPLANAYPMMPDDELKRLADDMKEHGFNPRFPIILYEEKILDGRNRQVAAGNVGVTPIYAKLPKSADPEVFVRQANEHRRHLNVEWLRKRREERVTRVAEARREGASLNTIAGKESISVTQVRRDLEVAGSTLPPGNVEPEGGVVKGLDGRTQTAKQARGVGPIAAAAKAVKADASPPGPQQEGADSNPYQDKSEGQLRKEAKKRRLKGAGGMKKPGLILALLEDDEQKATFAAADTPLDGVGLPIPADKREAFAIRPKVAETISMLRKAYPAIHEIAAHPGGAHYRRWMRAKGDKEGKGIRYHEQDLVHACARLLHHQPYLSFCPRCEPRGGNRDCDTCLGQGWVSESAFHNLNPRELALIEVRKAALKDGH